MPNDQIPTILQFAFAWLNTQPVFLALLLLMVIDVACGIFLALSKRTLSSTISWRGMSKKCIELLLVAMFAVIQPHTPNLPLLSMGSLFFLVTEALSILENAAAAGVPLPRGLVRALAKLRDDQRIKTSQKSPPAEEGKVSIPADFNVHIDTNERRK